MKDHSIQHLDQVFGNSNIGGSGRKASNSTQYQTQQQQQYQQYPPQDQQYRSSSSNSSSNAQRSREERAQCTADEALGYADSTAAATSRYVAQLRSCEMRHVILRNEMEEVSLEEELMSKKRNKIKNGNALSTFIAVFDF